MKKTIFWKERDILRVISAGKFHMYERFICIDISKQGFEVNDVYENITNTFVRNVFLIFYLK